MRVSIPVTRAINRATAARTILETPETLEATPETLEASSPQMGVTKANIRIHGVEQGSVAGIVELDAGSIPDPGASAITAAGPKV
jgi:hypothetical protein